MQQNYDKKSFVIGLHVVKVLTNKNCIISFHRETSFSVVGIYMYIISRDATQVQSIANIVSVFNWRNKWQHSEFVETQIESYIK
jgi:Na+-translocating ferredoxin:NAD+ oxidoreductase RnfE subunit